MDPGCVQIGDWAASQVLVVKRAALMLLIANDVERDEGRWKRQLCG